MEAENPTVAESCACPSADAHRCVEARYRRPMRDDDDDLDGGGDPCECSCHDDGYDEMDEFCSDTATDEAPL